MIERSVNCLGPHGFHRVVYSEYAGPPGAPTLVCVHGLTRNGKDFEIIAEALSAHYRVICPDMPGRGRSDYLAAEDYSYPLYVADMAALIARLDVESVDWIGTSMGGLIGMMTAAQPGTPIRRLVLNDVGAFIPQLALQRIADYVGFDPTFPSLEIMEKIIRQNYAPYGPLTDAQMRRMTEISATRRPDGSYGFAYDPKIAVGFKAVPIQDANLWPVWDAVKCPVLLVRGADSDVLPREVAGEMTRRGPKAKLVEFAGIGHAPPLLSEDQIAPIRDFLTA